MTLIANLLWATHDCVSQRSPSSDDKCECTLCKSSSKHSAASPKHPNGNLRPARGPLAKALRNGSGHKAGSDDVWSCWNNSYEKRKKTKQILSKGVEFVKVYTFWLTMTAFIQRSRSWICSFWRIWCDFMSLLERVDDFVWSSVFLGLARGKVPVDDGDDVGDAVGSLRLYRNLIILSHYSIWRGWGFE